MTNNTWLQLYQPAASTTHNLICLPFAGGFAEYYLTWRSELPAAYRLCPIQLPGRSYRWQETVHEDIQSLLTDMVPKIQPAIEEKPYILFGHSMGGYIAYELVKELTKQQLPLPELMVVSSIPAPQYWMKRKHLTELTAAEFSEFFFDLGGFHPELLKHERFIQMQMALLRSDILLCESCGYEAPAALPVPIIAMGGLQDDYVPIESMSGWSQETQKQFNLHSFTGNHFYLNDHLPTIMKLITQGMSV